MPKDTLASPKNRLPSTGAAHPPATVPLAGELPVTTDQVYVYRSLLVAGVVPAAVVTEIRTWPAACAGEVAMIEVGEDTV